MNADNSNKEIKKERSYLEVLMDQCYCEQVAQEEYIEQIKTVVDTVEKAYSPIESDNQ